MARVSAERAEEQTKSDDEKTVLEEDAARYSGAYLSEPEPNASRTFRAV